MSWRSLTGRRPPPGRSRLAARHQPHTQRHHATSRDEIHGLAPGPRVQEREGGSCGEWEEEGRLRRACPRRSRARTVPDRGNSSQQRRVRQRNSHKTPTGSKTAHTQHFHTPDTLRNGSARLLGEGGHGTRSRFVPPASLSQGHSMAVFTTLAEAVEIKIRPGSTAHWSIHLVRLNGWLRQSFTLLTSTGSAKIGKKELYQAERPNVRTFERLDVRAKA